MLLSEVRELRTTEAGGVASFTLALSMQPKDTVVVPLSSSDTTEGTVAPAQLTFTKDNWNAPQTVMITGVDDELADGTVSYDVVIGALESSDVRFNGYDLDDLSVSNVDNDSAGVSVKVADKLSTTESGGSARFSVVLNAEPRADVAIAVSSSDAGEGSAARQA
jgi:hypothetical protein